MRSGLSKYVHLMGARMREGVKVKMDVALLGIVFCAFPFALDFGSADD